MNAETIHLHLMHGDANRLRVAKITNWNGIGVAAPRTEMPDFLSREELQRTGLYLLLGQNDEDGRPLAYVGEGDNLANRIRQHKSREFWNQAVAFTSNDHSLTKAHAKWLESKLLSEAATIGRYALLNKADSKSRLSEFDQASTDVFYTRVKQLLPILGSNIVTAVSVPSMQKDTAQYSYKVRNAEAFGDRTPNGFVIYKGSTAVMKERKGAITHGAWSIALRKKLVLSGSLVPVGEALLFAKDVEFNSPSAAAAVVAGGPAAGPLMWKDKDGKTLKEIEASL